MSLQPYITRSLSDASLPLRKLQKLQDLVFLDSAHELDETFLELSLYYDILEPGGIMFGDDYGWAAVRQDVQRFVEHRNSRSEADPPEFRIIRAEPGSSHVLWMLRKPKVEP